MELTLDLKKQYSYADYLTWSDGARRELIDGRMNMLLSVESTRHQQISRRLLLELTNFIGKKKLNYEVFYAPFEVRFPKESEITNDRIDSVVQPDICIVCDPAKLDKRGCIGAPDMIIEVLSPHSSSYDICTKFDLYEREGVREYWIANQEEGLDIFVLQSDGKYGEEKFRYEHETVSVHVLPGCEIELRNIYK